MKTAIIFVFALFFGALTFGQSKEKEVESITVNGNQKTIKYTDGSQSISIIKENTSSSYKKKYPFKSKQDEMAYLKKYIFQLEAKKEKVKSNPEEDKQAKESGWYAEMDKFISQSKARIKEIEELLKTKK